MTPARIAELDLEADLAVALSSATAPSAFLRDWARDRISAGAGAGEDQALAAAYWAELAAWPEWGEWLPEPAEHEQPFDAPADERWWDR